MQTSRSWILTALAAILISIVVPMQAAERVFDVTARQWEFTITPPSPDADIVVNQGDVVVLRLRSLDVQHGFFVEHYVSDRSITTSVSEVRFTATTAGEFVFFCTQSTCGAGHTDMTGRLLVKPTVAVTLASIAPTSGPVAGGTQVTLSGSGFVSGATVKFGDAAAGNVTVTSGTSITAIAPPHAAGAVAVTVTNVDGGTATLAGAFTYSTPTVDGSLLFHSIPPCRAHDTRNGDGAIPANSFRAFQIAGRCGVPATAKAVSANFTVTNLHGVGFLSVYPENGPLPRQVSTLNFDGARWALANAAIVPLRDDGGITAFAASSALDLIVDVNGYFAPPSEAGGLFFQTLTPCRTHDSRGEGGLLTDSTPRSWTLAGRCAVPADAAAISGNLTVTQMQGNGFVRLYPEEGQPSGGISTLNFSGDQWALANAAIVPLRSGGSMSVMANISSTHALFDVNGYFGAQGAGGMRYFAIPPCRLFDTRGTSQMAANSFRAFTAAGSCGIPQDALAVAGNFTVTNAGGIGFLSVYTNDGPPQQQISTINFAGDQWALANAAIVPLRSGGAFNVFAASVPVDVIFDVSGYFK